jgi:DNA-binding MarR family transcriptional regulator
MIDTPPASPDHETRVRARDHVALKLWLRLLTCTNLIESQIRRDLRTAFECTLPRFDLLAQLERVPEGLKMIELSRRLMVTGGNITGLADQLEAEGLIRRESVADDRRATRLKLTPLGRQRFGDMAAEHENWVAEMFGTLDRDELAQLFGLLGKLKKGLTSAPPGPSAAHPKTPPRT